MKQKHKNLTKGILSLMLIATMAMGLVPVPFVQENMVVHADGSCGDGLTWSLSGTALTISKTGAGTGAMTDYSYDNTNPAPWKTSGITSVTIGAGVTSIGNNAFVECSTLQSASIPNGITSIGMQAFAACTGLTSISIPSSVGSIGNTAFGGCNSLSEITIVGNGSTSIVSSAFYQCTGLQTVTIGSGVQSLGSSAFAYCSNLTTVTIGDDVTSIGALAFNNCSSLATVTIGKSVSSIGNMAFGGSVPATCNITIDPDNPHFTGGAFIINNGTLTAGISVPSDCVIPNTVTSIATAAFANKTGLVSLAIPSSVTSIGEVAFSGCTALTSATFIGGGTTAIGTGAFNNCPYHIYARADRTITGVNSNLISRYYIANVDDPENGEVSISGGDVPRHGDFFTNAGTATVTATPAAGYALATVAVTDQDSNSISVSGTGNTRTFTMPANKDVTVAATFSQVIAFPTAVTGLVYNGNAQTGVATGTGYTLTGNTATDAGNYTATATLANGYLWSDGTSEPKTISWSIAAAPQNNSSSSSSGSSGSSSSGTNYYNGSSASATTTTSTSTNKDGSKTTTETVTDPATGQVTETATTTKKDGTKVVEKTVTNKDGSEETVKTVTKKDGTTKVKDTVISSDGAKTVAVSEKTKNEISIRTASYDSDGGLTAKASYTPISGSKIKLTEITASGNKASIPSKVKIGNTTYRVTSIGANVLKGNTKVKVLVIDGRKLKHIAKGAFKDIDPNATIKIKASKMTYQKVVKMIKASGVPETVKFKRIK